MPTTPIMALFNVGGGEILLLLLLFPIIAAIIVTVLVVRGAHKASGHASAALPPPLPKVGTAQQGPAGRAVPPPREIVLAVRKCPYCGKEYSQDVEVCPLDQKRLFTVQPKPPIVS